MLPDKMCVQVASFLHSSLSASTPACKAPTGFPGVSGNSVCLVTRLPSGRDACRKGWEQCGLREI